MLQRKKGEKKTEERGVIIGESIEAKDVIIPTEGKKKGSSNNDKIYNKEGGKEERGGGGVTIIGNREKEVLDVNIL